MSFNSINHRLILKKGGQLAGGNWEDSINLHSGPNKCANPGYTRK